MSLIKFCIGQSFIHIVNSIRFNGGFQYDILIIELKPIHVQSKFVYVKNQANSHKPIGLQA